MKFYNKCSENSRSQIVFRTDIFPKIAVGCPRESDSFALLPTTGTGNEKRRTLRKSSLYREDQLACLHCRFIPVVPVVPVVPAVLVAPVGPFVPVIPVVPTVQAPPVVQKLDSSIYG